MTRILQLDYREGWVSWLEQLPLWIPCHRRPSSSECSSKPVRYPLTQRMAVYTTHLCPALTD